MTSRSLLKSGEIETVNDVVEYLTKGVKNKRLHAISNTEWYWKIDLSIPLFVQRVFLHVTETVFFAFQVVGKRFISFIIYQFAN